jgi:hypothetical protein
VEFACVFAIAGIERIADEDVDASPPWPLRSTGKQMLGSRDPHRYERTLRASCDEGRPGLQLLQPRVVGPAAFGKQDQVPAFLNQPDGQAR